MWPALISGGASLLGSIFSSETSAQNTQAQIAASEQMQQQQMNFQQQMSNTAYQRSSADMKAAGLNPMMMFGSGGPASTPAGSSTQAPMPQRTSPFAGIGDAVKSGIQSYVTSKELDKVAEQTANVKLQNDELQRTLDAGGPEAKVALEKQMRNIRIPEETRGTGYTWLPETLKQMDVYADPVKRIGSAVEQTGDAFWSMLPGGKFLRGFGPSSSAKAKSSDDTMVPRAPDPATGNSATSFRRGYDRALEELDRRSSMKNAPPARFDDRFNPVGERRTGIPWPNQGWGQ